MRPFSNLEQTAGPPLASLTFAVMKSQIRSLQRAGVSMLHTARSFDYYRKVFFRGRSSQSVLASLRGKRVVDVGCGITPYAEDSMFQRCHAEGIEFYGIDPVLAQRPSLGWRERALAKALGGRGRFNANAPGLTRALACRADDLPFDDNSVDQILCSYLMFVWINDEADLAAIFSEYWRTLKPNGIIRLYPFYQWQFTRFENQGLINVLDKFHVEQHFVHGGFDLRITPSMLTEFRKIS